MRITVEEQMFALFNSKENFWKDQKETEKKKKD